MWCQRTVAILLKTMSVNIHKVPCLTFFILISQAVSCWAASVEEISTSWTIDLQTLPVILVLVGVSIVVCVAVLLMCTGCYNAEVDTSNHPACRGSKSGHGYMPTSTDVVNDNVMQSSFDTGEYVTPSSNNAPLPYTMIPTHIPEDGGFRGYDDSPRPSPSAAAGYTTSNTGGLVGYGASQSTAPARGGTHINPMEPEEPPPSYGEALHGYG